jgi:hypothetical protein
MERDAIPHNTNAAVPTAALACVPIGHNIITIMSLQHPPSSVNDSAGGPAGQDDATRQRLADGKRCLDAALEYLSLGFCPLSLCPPDHIGVLRVNKNHLRECRQPGKVPWHPWGVYQDKQPTERDVRSWWQALPNSNVGTALGEGSHMCRVDVEGVEGMALLERKAGGRLPDTWQFRSGRTDSVGMGYLFRLPPGLSLRTTRDSCGPGQEVRFQAKGAQTVLPPSRHVSGRLYAWLPGHAPGEVPLATAPDWLLAELTEAKRGRRAGGKAPGKRGASTGETIPEGSRNTTLASLAGTMRHRGMTFEEILAAILVANERCDPPLPEAEVEGIARSIAGYAPAHSDQAHQGNGKANAGAAFGVVVQGLQLNLTDARKTAGGKIVAAVAIARGGRRVDSLTLSSAPSARQAAARTVAGHAEAADLRKIDAALGEVLVQAEELAGKKETRSGKPLKEIVAAFITDHYRLSFRTARGAWSEALGREVTRAEFITHTPDALMAQAAQAGQAVDVGGGADGEVDRPALHRDVETELKILWATLTAPLRTEAEVGLGKDSKAGEEFRRGVVRLFKQTATFEVAKGAGDQSVTASRSSLAARVMTETRKYLQLKDPVEAPKGWKPVQRAFDAFWRVDLVGGVPVLRLALKYTLTFQIGVPLPGVSDQRSLTDLAAAYGCQDTDLTVKDRLTGGGRLLVLSRDLVEAITERPEEEVEAE